MSLQLDKKKASTGSSRRSRKPSFSGTTYIPEEEQGPSLRLTIGLAVAIHILLFIVGFPSFDREIHHVARAQKAYVVQEVRFESPPPRSAKPIPKRKAKKIPMPDPTPDEPEPITDVEVDLPEMEIEVENYGEAFDLPAGPPSRVGDSAVYIEGDVTPPEKIYAPKPLYTEDARRARVQGVVLLQLVIDTEGYPHEIKVIRGLPEGLEERAVAAVKEWRWRPATLKGEPVAVFLNLSVNFGLQ